MLEIRNLCYQYKGNVKPTLENLNASFKKGEMALIAGRSGCGKSTFIKAITGTLQHKDTISGSICIDGIDTKTMTVDTIGLQVGAVYQTPEDQLFALRVYDEVAFVLENQGIEDEEIRKSVLDVLALVGLEEMEQEEVTNLSGGQRQRLALASVLVCKPQILILDEPVSQIDPLGVIQFMNLLKRVNEVWHTTILVIEHRVNELYKYFERILIMDEGAFVYDGFLEFVWETIREKQIEGIRVPQIVKLCSLLGAPFLTTHVDKVTKWIQSNCEIKLCSSKEVQANSDIEKKPLLEIKDLDFSYDPNKKKALEHISLSIYPGEIIALMGRNGAGKSTLFNILGGLLAGDSSKIVLQKEIEKNLTQARYAIGYLRQEPDLMLLANTIEEEFEWGATCTEEKKTLYLLKIMDLLPFREKYPQSLSKGQRLRTVLGAIYRQNPYVLLLDEPTTGQDEECLRQIKGLFAKFASAGGAMFMITHDMELAAQLAHRIIIMKDGKILSHGSGRDIFSNDCLLEECGLSASPLGSLCKELHIPHCVLAEEVTHYVSLK